MPSRAVNQSPILHVAPPEECRCFGGNDFGRVHRAYTAGMYGHNASEAIREADMDGKAGGIPLYALRALASLIRGKTLHKLNGLTIDGRQRESETVR